MSQDQRTENPLADRDVDARGNCSKCGGPHYGSYYCPMPTETVTMNASAEMPRYQSHKKVWALKIKDVTGCTITPADDGYAPFEVLPEMYLRYTPVPGDYYVVYEDGYKPFSPAKAFEEGYARV